MFNYSINSVSSKTSYNKHNIVFGQIRPEHLFINVNGFGKDYNWADEMIKLIDSSKTKLQKGEKFNDVLNYISQKYHEYFINNISEKPGVAEENALFGKLRKKGVVRTMISSLDRYEGYVDRILNFTKTSGTIYTKKIKNKKLEVKKLSLVKKQIPLSSTEILQENIPKNLRQVFGPEIIFISSSPVKSIIPALKHVEKLCSDITAIKKVSDRKNLEFCNNKIAEIHWFLSQVMPFHRGSAGITDIFTKSLYESLGVQVSPWKKGIIPDLEAYARKLEDYVKSYPTFFEKPPEIMNN